MKKFDTLLFNVKQLKGVNETKKDPYDCFPVSTLLICFAFTGFKFFVP